MNELNWGNHQNSYTQRFKTGTSRAAGRGRQGDPGRSKSYMDSFLRKGGYPHGSNGQRMPEQDVYSSPQHSQNYHHPQENWFQSPHYAHPQEMPPANGNAHVNAPPQFSGPGMTADQSVASNWNFYDLKNKKQTGDLYRRIAGCHKKNGNKVFGFVSSRGGEGVTTVVANLVNYTNREASGKRVLIIDANSSRTGLGDVFRVPRNTYGLIELFSGYANVNQVVTQVSSNHFFIGIGGGQMQGQSRGLDHENFSRLLNYCKEFYDLIIIDYPPVLSSVDALTITPAADRIFLVIRAAKVQRPVVEQARTLLQNNECHIEGVVLNRVKQVIPGWVYKFI